MLDRLGVALGLGSSRIARAMAAEIARVIAAADRPPRVVVVGRHLGRALERAGLAPLVVSPAPRARRPGPPEAVARPDALPLADHTVDALCLSRLPPDPLPALRECARVVRPGGLVAVAAATGALRRRVAAPEEVAALLVHAALVDIEQRTVGAALLTTARVPAAATAWRW